MLSNVRKIDLQLFNNTQTTLTNDTSGTYGGPGGFNPPATNDLSPEMKTFYSDYLIDNAVPNLVHDQFGQKHPIPKNGGKVIEFRKYSPFDKATQPITEGVTPNGHKLNVETVTATVNQYGDYVELSDVLLLTAIDNNMVQATKLLGNQAGETLDWVTREVLNGGTNVLLAKGSAQTRPAHRYEIGPTNTLSVDDILNAVRTLKKANAKKIGDSYIGIVGPDIAYTLMRDSEWINWHQYANPEELYEGEIGKIGGVRFIETTEAKIFEATKLTAASAKLTVKTASTSSTTLAVVEAISSDEAAALAGVDILIGTDLAKIASATAGAAGSATLTLASAGSYAKDAVIAAANAGAGGADVYSTLILADNAYGVTEIAGGGLQHIVKQLGSSGSADPLDQRATVGWKAIKTAERLVEGFMVRIESSSK